MSGSKKDNNCRKCGILCWGIYCKKCIKKGKNYSRNKYLRKREYNKKWMI